MICLGDEVLFLSYVRECRVSIPSLCVCNITNCMQQRFPPPRKVFVVSHIRAWGLKLAVGWTPILIGTQLSRVLLLVPVACCLLGRGAVPNVTSSFRETLCSTRKHGAPCENRQATLDKCSLAWVSNRTPCFRVFLRKIND